MRKRCPSRFTEYRLSKIAAVRGVSNSGWGTPASKFAPPFTSTAINVLSFRKNSSLPSARHLAHWPAFVETLHLAPVDGNGCT